MALSAELENLLTELGKVDPDGAKEQRALLEKNEKLAKFTQEHAMRQSDYDRHYNENKTQIEYGQSMKKWADDNVPKYDKMKSERDQALADKAKLEKDLQEAARKAAAAPGGGTGTLDPQAIADAVRQKLGEDIPTKTELASLIAAETSKQTEQARKDFFEKTFPAAMKYNADYLDAKNQYFQETGKRLDDKEFSKFLVDNKIDDPAKGFEQFMKPQRDNAEIERKAKERADAILKERGEGNRSIPGTSGEPGHLQVRVQTKAKDDQLFNSSLELGDGSLAAQAAAELTAEGK